MNFNPEIFSIIGYASVLAWVVAAVLCIIYAQIPSRLFCTIVMGLTALAFVGARVNSKTHVDRIQLDRSEEMAKQNEMERARKQALMDSRGGEVAQVRFAEDGSGDFLDRAGMDETDLKYFESQGLVPEWKKEKKERSAGGVEDDSIEAEIGGKEVISGVESTEATEGESKAEPIMMLQNDKVLADRMDLLNLRITFYMLFVGVAMILIDYLRRANLYGKSSFPLPIPSRWLNIFNPIPARLDTKKLSQRGVRRELNRLVKRGDSFLYLTDDPARTQKFPESIARLPLFGKEDVISVTDEVDEEFVFEALWHGRSSFVVSSGSRAQQQLDYILRKLEQRREVRARVFQTAHVVLDLQTPLSQEKADKLEELAKATGLSALFIHRKTSKTKDQVRNQTNPQGEPLTT